MGKTSRIFFTLILATLLCGCEKDAGQNIFTMVTLNLCCPSVENATVERLVPDNSLAGTFIRDINTLQEYEVPVFQVGTANIRLRKGVYLMAFDGEATFTDGSVRNVRFSKLSSPENAVHLLQDTETLTLELTVLR